MLGNEPLSRSLCVIVLSMYHVKKKSKQLALVIPHKIGPGASGPLDECAPQILRGVYPERREGLRMTARGCVILSTAKDLARTYGESPV